MSDDDQSAARQARANKALVDAMYGGLNENRLGIMTDYWHQNMVWDGPAGIGRKEGIDAFEQDYRAAFIRAFPDKHAEDIVRIAEDDWVAGTGFQDTTFAADWLGIPATNEKVRVRYMDFWRVAPDPETGERKLAENLVLIDILGVLEQAGYNVEKVLRYVGSKPPEYFNSADD